MIVRFAVFLLLLASIRPLFAEEENTPQATPRPGFFHRVINIFHKDKGAESKEAKDKSKILELTMEVSPQPLKLSEGNKIQVTLRLTNKTGKLAQLDFPTTQRIEVLLHNQAGKLVAQWSEEQSFVNDPGFVSIDPGERVEYIVTISGRDLVAGQAYTLEGFFPNYEKLRVSKTIIPVR